MNETQLERMRKLSARLKELSAVSGREAASYILNGGGAILAELYAREAFRLALDASDLDELVIEYRFANAKKVN